MTGEYVAEAVQLALSEQPDVIVVTGDFIHKGYRFVDRAARDLRGLAAPHGVFAVLGNHDYSIRNALGIRRYRHLNQAVASALRAEGIRVLRNEAVTLHRGGAQIHLAGVDDLWSRSSDLERALHGLDSKTPRVVLAHNPRTIEHLGGRRCDVMLTGHTHGGQVNWPGLGRVALGKQSDRYTAGLYRCGRTHLYVNKGVGFGVRFRFGVRPEVASFTLVAAKEPDSAGAAALCTLDGGQI